MIEQLHALVLGIIQGLTEFLPVSSSAHLVIIPWLLGWDDPGLAFDVALHLGTLLALLIFYWRQWLAMIASLFNGDRAHQRLLMLLIIASLPGAAIGVLFEKQAESTFRSPPLIAVSLATMGFALWYFDRVRPERRTLEQISTFDALLIGLSQAFAIIPGVSRSGATITTARLVSMNREDSANFSFLMATPIIAGAGILEGRHLAHAGGSSALGIGFGAAAVFGLIAISGLIRFVRTRTYGPFAWYRLALAVFIVIIALMRG
jgi:undecaprenyl-diphosphatase